ncbi:MAG: nascent polypeptide-associated complex protein [Candidatus Methanofastidiosia archaeon]
MPGMNPRKMQKLMKQLGMKQKEIEALKVIIETPKGNLIFENPQVTETQVQGQSTFQIVGKYTLQNREEEITEEDIKLVSEQAKVSKEKALEALKEAKGDLAQAIVELENKR